MNSELKPKIRFKGFTDDWEQRKLNKFSKYITSNKTSSDVITDGLYDLYDANTIIGKISESPIKEEYITIIKDGSGVGKVRRLPKDTLFIGTMGGILAVNSNIDFVYCNLLKTDFTKEINGATIPHVYYSSYGNNEYFIPTIDEQNKIGAMFNNIDNLITLHQRKCDKLLELKKSLLEKMFPQNNSVIPEIRFKGFTDDWEQRKLSDNLKNIQTGTNLLGSINNLGTPLLKMGNIQRGYFTTDKLEYLKDYSSIEKENIANFGDFFFNTRNTLELVGKGATWFGISGKYAFNSNIARFTFEGINTTFFNYLYNTESLLKQVHSRATGTTSVAAIYPQSLNTIEYMLPSYDEQSKIGNLLLDLDNIITLHQRKHDKLNKIKQSLLNDMFV